MGGNDVQPSLLQPFQRRRRIFRSNHNHLQHFSPKAFVEICVADKENDVLTESDDGEVPDCYKPPPTDGSNVVCYNLEINCVSECVDEAQERKRTLLQQAGGWFFDGEQ